VSDVWLPPRMAMIFDMDGVIIDSNPIHVEAWTAYNRRFAVDAGDAVKDRMYGRRNDDIVREFFGAHLSREEIAAHGTAKEQLYREMVGSKLAEVLVPGVWELLEHHAGLPVGLATNAEPANVDFLLDGSGLRQFFRVIIDGHQVMHPKPHPEIYLLAAKLLSVEPYNCVVFEDSFSGVEAAHAAGARVVGLRTTHADLPDVDLAVDNFFNPELERWLRAQTPRAW
jgi:beta-phosphoglucomutase